MSKIILLLLSINMIPLSAQAQAAGNKAHDDVLDQDALRTLTEFWTYFDEYERRLKGQKQAKYLESWQQYQKAANEKDKELSKAQIKHLLEAAKEYEEHKTKYKHAGNAPHVLLNLAQVYKLLANTKSQSHQEKGLWLQKTLDSLTQIDEVYPAFAQRDAALYLKALTYEDLQRTPDAIKSWQRLAALQTRSIYTMYAHLALGDYFFNTESPQKAITHYQEANKLISEVPQARQEQESFRIYYRLAWAAYRSTNLKLAMDSAIHLLVPGQKIDQLDQHLDVKKDAVQLFGDALFEDGRFSVAKRRLSDRRISESAPAIGLHLMTKFVQNSREEHAIEIGEFLSKEFSQAAELPEWLSLLAGSYEKSGKNRRRLATLERLALLLPAESLWRAKHRGQFDVLDRMDVLARNGARLAASIHYDQGLGSGSAKSFAAAATFYDLLTKHLPNDRDSNQWRLRLAHCRYFSGHYIAAATMYEQLREEYKLSAAQLEVNMYQTVMAWEKAWQHAVAKASKHGEKAQADTQVLKLLTSMESAVDRYAAKYPHRSRSIDLLILAGSANRDLQRFAEADRFWERALLLPGNSGQRVNAIQGLVYSTMKSEAPQRVVALAKRYLKLEDWNKMPASLKSELEGVLSSATSDAAKELEAKGNIRDAGTLLMDIATEHPHMPNRSEMLRNGAYLLAMAGAWQEAEKGATAYLSFSETDHLGDMIYLQARSAEQQIRFRDAATHYFKLAKQFPDHPKALASLGRAEALAVAENEYVIAGDAAFVLGNRTNEPAEQLRHYNLAMDHYRLANRLDKVEQAGKRIASRSSDIATQLTAKARIARTHMLEGDQKKALDEFQTIAMTAQASKRRLGSAFSDLYGEANFWIGHDAHATLSDYNIKARSGKIREKIARKLNYFEKTSRLYATAINSNSPEWSSRARFELAMAANEMADSISTALRHSQNAFKSREAQKYEDSIDRLQRLARRNHSDNLLSKNRFPKEYKDNTWVMKSAIKLNTEEAGGLALNDDSALESSVEADLPQQWSL